MKKVLRRRNLKEAKSMNDIGFQELIDSLSGSDYYPSQIAYFIANFYDDGSYTDYGEGMEYWNEFLDKVAIIYHKAAKQIRALEKDPKYHTEETYGEMDKYDKKWVDESKKSAKGRKLTEDEEKIIVHELPDDAYGQDYWNWLTDDEGLYGKDGKNGLIILYDDGRNILKNYTQFSDEELEDAIYEDGANGLSELIGKEYKKFDIGYYPVGEFSNEWLSELSDVAKGDFTVYEVQNNEDWKYETIIGDTVFTTFSKRGSDEEQIAEILGVSPEQIVIKKPRRTYVYDSYQPTRGRKLNETWAGEDVITDLVDRAKGWIDDGNDLEDAVSRALDDGLIYTKDIRTLAEHYDVLPDDGELIELFYEELYGDVYNEASNYYDEVHGDNDEDDEETESFKSRKGKKLDEAGKAKNVFDFDTVDIELEDIKELYNEDGVEGVTDLSWENIKANYPEFAKVFKYFSDYIYDDFITTEEAWDNMDEPLYKAVMEFVSGRKKQDPVDLIKKYDPSLKVVLTSDPEPTPEEDEFADDDDFIYDFDDDMFDMSDEERAEMRKIGEFERKANRK